MQSEGPAVRFLLEVHVWLVDDFRHRRLDDNKRTRRRLLTLPILLGGRGAHSDEAGTALRRGQFSIRLLAATSFEVRGTVHVRLV